MLAAREERALVTRGEEYRACDHLPKPIDIDELMEKVKERLKIKAFQEELKRSNELSRDLSDTDPFTHIYNGRNRTKILNCEATRTKQNDEDRPYIIYDIDNFKKVNDIYEQQNGDEVMITAADAVRAKRGYDAVARYGREGFGVLNIYV